MKKEKADLEWRKYWKEKAEKLQKENLILKDKLKLAELELKILRPFNLEENPNEYKSPYWKGIRELI